MLHQYIRRVYSCDCIFMEDCLLLIRVCAKGKKKAHYLYVHYIILLWTHVWMCQFISQGLYVGESSYESSQ